MQPGFIIQNFLQQRAHTDHLESVAEHYDDELVRVAALLKAANERAAKAEAERNELLHSLAVQKVHSKALLAQVEAFAAEHPDSRLMKQTGDRKKDGSPERVVTQAYNKVFDALFEKLKLGNPRQYRY